MTKEEIRLAYLDCIEHRIKSSETFAGDELFDKIRDIGRSPEGYNLFYPLTSDYGDEGIVFDALCGVYGNMQYCWEDDGCMSFVHTTVQYKFNPERDTKPCYGADSFVMWGDPDCLPKESVEEWALKHFEHGSKLCKYRATIFTKEVVNYLHSLIPEWERITKLANSGDIEDDDKYFKESNNLQNVYKHYIETSKFVRPEVVLINEI